MDRSPPPFFRQGVSADVRLALFALFAIVLLVLDARFGALAAVRQAIGTALFPMQRALLVPRDLAGGVAHHMGGVRSLSAEVEQLRARETANALLLQQAQHTALENLQLRRLLGMRERGIGASVVAEVLHETRDPFTRNLMVDRGQQHGVAPGQPVLDAEGVLGQVSRVLPLAAEITLLTDRNLTLSVEIRRNGTRALAYGSGRAGALELRYLPAAADLQPGDQVVTSGLDGVFPPGLPVGKVIEVIRRRTSFTTARVEPAAAIERTRMVLILLEPWREPLAAPVSEEPRRAAPPSKTSK
jgi:rod shape-determining protein MreC